MKRVILDTNVYGNIIIDEKNEIFNYNLSLFNLVDNSLVEIPRFISKNKLSYVQTKQFNFNASATNSISLTCSFNNSFALTKNSLYSSNGINLIILKIIEANSLNSSSKSFDLDNISDLLLMNSSLNLSGANNSRSSSNSKFISSSPEINILNRIFESRTTFNYISPSAFNLLYIESLTFLDNNSASFSVNSDLDIISLNLFSISSRLISLSNSSLLNSDQFTQDNFLISDLISSGTANVNETIYDSPIAVTFSNSFNCLTLRINISLSIEDHFTLGNLSILSFNSFGIDKVIVAIFIFKINYVKIHKYVRVYKTFVEGG